MNPQTGPVKEKEEPTMNPQPRDERPWGYFDVLLEDAEHKVKRIVVYP